MIPMAPEEISPEWLAGALAHRFPGVRVRAVRVADQHAGTTGRARIVVDYDDAAGAPAQVFVKLPPGDPGQREMVRSVGMGRREARFYDEVAASVPVRIPEPYFAASNEEGTEYVMLLEDLEPAGCAFPTPRDEKIATLADRLVVALGVLHARFWESERFRGDLDWVVPAMRHEIGPTLVARSVELFRDEMPPAFAEIGAIYTQHTDPVCDLWDEGEETLVHGDCHIGNLFTDGDDVGFLDWACTSRSVGLRDVSYFLCNSLPTEVRRARERELLRVYLDTLAGAGAPAPDFDTAWRRHRRLAAYSWVAAATTAAMGDAWQPIEIGRASIERATDAVADLETVPLFRQELGLA